MFSFWVPGMDRRPPNPEEPPIRIMIMDNDMAAGVAPGPSAGGGGGNYGGGMKNQPPPPGDDDIPF